MRNWLWLLFFPALMNAQTMQVMTFNIRYDNLADQDNQWTYRKEGVVDLIRYYAPTVFGVQEALHSQMMFLDNQLSNYAFIGVGREDGKTKGEYAAIFYDTTALKLLQQNTFWLSYTPDTVSKGWDAAIERICTVGKFKQKTTEKTFWIFNTHFDHKGKRARRKSVELIVNKMGEAFREENAPLVLMGDLNLLPDAKAILKLQEFLQDAQRISSIAAYGPAGTFNGFDTSILLEYRIDYIFTKDFQVQTYRHIEDRLPNGRYPSDHLPVLAEVAFRD